MSAIEDNVRIEIGFDGFLRLVQPAAISHRLGIETN